MTRRGWRRRGRRWRPAPTCWWWGGRSPGRPTRPRRRGRSTPRRSRRRAEVPDDRAAGAMALRRSFEVRVGERAVITENVVSTGGSVLEVADLLVAAGASVTGVATIIDRLRGRTRLPLPFSALARVEAAAWEPAECPICRTGSAVESLG